MEQGGSYAVKKMKKSSDKRIMQSGKIIPIH